MIIRDYEKVKNFLLSKIEELNNLGDNITLRQWGKLEKFKKLYHSLVQKKYVYDFYNNVRLCYKDQCGILFNSNWQKVDKEEDKVEFGENDALHEVKRFIEYGEN